MTALLPGLSGATSTALTFSLRGALAVIRRCCGISMDGITAAAAGLSKSLADRWGLCHHRSDTGGDAVLELLTEVIVAGLFVYGLGFVIR